MRQVSLASRGRECFPLLSKVEMPSTYILGQESVTDARKEGE